MADEAIATPAAPEAQATTTEATATTPAVAKNTDTQAEPMIPKSRLDEVLGKLKNYESEKAKAERAASEAETQRLAEQGKYKEIADKLKADLEAAQQAAKSNEMRLLQRDAAATTGLPAALADRLKGETLEEMIADARAILGALPKPTAPNLNGANGDGAVPRNGALDEEAKRRIADKLGVNPKYIT